MAPKKSEKVRKLVPLKMPYEELRPFRHELRELRLEFLLWNWNCVSTSMEVMDKSATEGEELRGMGLLTREEEKRFPRERESFTVESSEGTEDENRSPAVPTHTTARGPVQVDVVQRQEQPERRVTKRRKVVSDNEEKLAHVVRRMGMDVSGAQTAQSSREIKEEGETEDGNS
ncbi:hypothetical protein AXG93_3671s1230 [Marchantia polymorpha subsp. ruderalis]|uniref:Uncharacterized protein n=1 Tax=Marchantia polymorpha subsp. ruderalis TaxID=1480154 RepID=A0A176WHN7_MARPO|nr:hypothetical protein AXG93_3671s1230 [Marchantia polymorpha subsp. ruderalis]